MAAAGDVDAERLVAAIKSRLGCRGQPDAEVRLWDKRPKVDQMLAPEYVSLGPRQWDQYRDLKRERESDKLKRLNDLLFKAVRDNNIPFEHFLSNLIDRVIATLGNNHQDHGSQQECSRAIELVKRMLLDGCYIVQVFANGCRPPRQDNSPSSSSPQETHRGLCKVLAEGRRCLINCICVMMNTRGEGEGGAEVEANNVDLEVGRRGVGQVFANGRHHPPRESEAEGGGGGGQGEVEAEAAGEVEADQGEVESDQGKVEADQGEVEVGQGEVEADQGEEEADQGEVEAGQGEVEADQGEVEAGQGEVQADQREVEASQGEVEAEAEAHIVVVEDDRTGVVIDERTAASLWRDTWFLVDNCVPYTVVDEINRLVYTKNTDEGLKAAEAAQRYLQRWYMYYCAPTPTPTEPVQLPEGANYLLGLFAGLLKPKDPSSSSLLNDDYSTCCGGRRHLQEEGAQRWVWQWQRATDYLRCCNARFVVSPLDGKDRLSVLDVTATIRGCFRSIDVRVPHLHINDYVLVLLRNLVELEQRGLRTTPCRYVTAYCYFMYKIASQPEDVEFLQREGIIDHAYNDPKDVVQGLREVVEGASVSDYSYLLPIAEELGRRFYKSTVHRRLSWLRASYWTKADILAIITVFLTLVTIFLGVPGIVYGALSLPRH